MMTKDIGRALAGLVLSVLFFQAHAGAATLDYQGRISSDGQAFSGTGYFKFELHDGKGKSLWKNDTSEGTGTPERPVNVPVRNGLFTVQLGDSVSGMRPIPALALHSESLSLRTWFSTNSAEGFEQLKPDVEIHSLDLAHFNTGNLIVVDDSPGGDFSDLQKAVNAAAANPDYDAVLIMPGRYRLTAPLTVPGNRQLLIRGLGREWVQIESEKGAALVCFNGVLEDVTLTGNPAIGDASASGAYDLTVRQCAISASGVGAAIEVSRKGSLELEGCRVSSGGGAALHVAGQASAVRVRSSELEGKPAVLLGAAGEVAPEIVGSILRSGGGKPPIDVDQGVSKSSIRLLHSVLSGDLPETIQLLAPAKELPYGNVVIAP